MNMLGAIILLMAIASHLLRGKHFRVQCAGAIIRGRIEYYSAGWRKSM